MVFWSCFGIFFFANIFRILVSCIYIYIFLLGIIEFLFIVLLVVNVSIIVTNKFVKKIYLNYILTLMPGYGALREEKTPQIHISHSHQLGSNPSIYSGGVGHGSQHSTGSLDQVMSPTSHSTKPINTGEDLYSWMAKQQEFIKDNDKGNLKGNWVSLITVSLPRTILQS